MPLFTFACPDCQEIFEELVFSLSSTVKVNCPECGSEQVKKQPSRVAKNVSNSQSYVSSSSAAACAPGGT